MGNTPNIRFKGFSDEWEQRKWEDIFITLPNNSLSRAELTSECGIIKNVHYGDILINYGEILDVKKDSIPYISSREYKCRDSALLQEGDIIVADAAEDNTVGKCSELVGLDNQMVLSGLHTIPCRPTRKFAKGYLGYYMNSGAYHDQLLPLIQGTKVSSITKSTLKKTSLVYPDVTEQELLGTFFSYLNNLITLHQRKCDETIELKKYMLQKMFPKDYEKVPQIRFDGFTGDWEQKKFSELFSEKRDKTKKENEDVLLSCAINGIFLNSELFSHFRGSSTIGYLKIRKNDLVLSAQNLHLGNANVNLKFRSGIISPAYKVYELIECDPNFIHAWVKKDTTKEFFLSCTTEGASACRKNINWNELNLKRIKVPTIDEQQKIGNYFFNLDNSIVLHQQKCNELKALKKYMLQNMFPQKG